MSVWLKVHLTFGIDALVRILDGAGAGLVRRTTILLPRRVSMTEVRSLLQLSVSPELTAMPECVEIRSSGSVDVTCRLRH